MEEKISIFDTEMDSLSAKEAMIRAIQFFENDLLDTIELMTLNMLMGGQEDPKWKRNVAGMDLVLPVEAEILEAAGIQDRGLLRDADERVFLRMFMKYLQKNRRRVFLLAETEEELMRVEEAVRRYQRGLNVVGHALLSPENDRRENVINDINGTETDCILSVLSSPYQEEFIADTRALLSAKVWFGCGKVLEQSYDERRLANRIKYFFMKKIFRYRVERQKDR